MTLSLVHISLQRAARVSWRKSSNKCTQTIANFHVTWTWKTNGFTYTMSLWHELFTCTPLSKKCVRFAEPNKTKAHRIDIFDITARYCFAESGHIMCFLIYVFFRTNIPHSHILPFILCSTNPYPLKKKRREKKNRTRERGKKRSCVLNLSRLGRLGTLPWFSMKTALILGTGAEALHSRRASSFLGKI